MQIVSALRGAGVATVLVVATIAYAPAFAQDQFQPSVTNAAPTGHQVQPNAPYSGAGSGDAQAKQGPEGCASVGGPIQPQTAAQLAQDPKGPSPYDGKASGAAKNAMATCGGQ